MCISYFTEQNTEQSGVYSLPVALGLKGWTTHAQAYSESHLLQFLPCYCM